MNTSLHLSWAFHRFVSIRFVRHDGRIICGNCLIFCKNRVLRLLQLFVMHQNGVLAPMVLSNQVSDKGFEMMRNMHADGLGVVGLPR